MTSADTVGTLETIRVHCARLLPLFQAQAEITERAMAAADSVASAVDRQIGGLRTCLQALTRAAAQESRSAHEEADGAVAALDQVADSAGTTRTHLQALVTTVDEACTRARESGSTQLQELVGGVRSVGAHVTAVGGALETLSETLVEGRSDSVDALSQAGRWLQEACDASDLHQREWRGGIASFFRMVHFRALLVSRTMSEAADAHALGLLATANQAVDRENELAGTLDRFLREDLELDLTLPREALGETMDELAMHAEERERQLQEAGAAAEARIESLLPELVAATAALASTEGIGQ